MIRDTETLWRTTLFPLICFSCILFQLSPSFSSKHTNTENSTRCTQTVCVQTWKDSVCRQTHFHAKPPSGQGLTLTLKGLCLATVIATPQAGNVVSTSTSMPLCVLMCVTTMYGANSRRHPKHAGLSHGFVRGCDAVCLHANNWETTAVPPTKRTIVPLTVVLCACACVCARLCLMVLGRQEMRSC